jgi:flagella basal body P-ring formation protein FlgA
MLAAFVLAAAASSAEAAPVAALAATEADVRAAIARAVEERVARPNVAIDVTIDDVRIHGGVAGAGLRATPDAGSRAGGPMRFILHAAGVGARGPRVGSVDAIVHLRTRYAQATRTLGPGTIVAPGDVTVVVGDPGRVPLQPLPQADALVGARLRRAIAAGGAIAADAVTAAPLVRSGDEVATLVRVGPVVAQGRATALEDGALGAIVRVQIEKRRLRGRVRGAGEVEITP